MSGRTEAADATAAATVVGTFLYGILLFIVVVLIIVLLVSLLLWLTGCGKDGCKKKGCETCPVYVKNPCPDDTLFLLKRVDGSATSSTGGTNGCATGSFRVQLTSPDELTYTVTTPAGTFITDIYTLEVDKPCDFPMVSDGCAVNLSLFHHQTYECDSTTNTQTFTSSIASLCKRSCAYLSILVVFSDDDSCTPLQMMTLATGKPIPMNANCVAPTCPTNSCCDPVIPNYTKIHIPKCKLPCTTTTC